MPARLFPILYGYEADKRIRLMREAGIMQIVIGLPWGMIIPHEAQAIANHSQTLQRLAERGGLGVGEAILVLTGKSLTFRPDTPADYAMLNKLLGDWLTGHPEDADVHP